MEHQKLANKILVMGIDGMDPELTRYHLSKGLMPNLQKFLERGSAREDTFIRFAPDDYAADVDYFSVRLPSLCAWNYRFLASASRKVRHVCLRLGFYQLPRRANLECFCRSRMEYLSLALAGLLVASNLGQP